MIVDFITSTKSGIILGTGKRPTNQKPNYFWVQNDKSLLNNVDLCIFAVFQVEYVE